MTFSTRAAALPLAFALAAAPLALLAQEAAPGATDAGTWSEIEDDTVMIEPWGLSVEEIDDMDVYGADGEQIAEVEDVLADATGAPAALALETESFLGLGSEDVIVTLDQLSLEGDRLTTSLSEDELEALPRWDD